MAVLQSLSLRLYADLMRLGQPTGIWLLLWPALWSLMMASGGHPPALALIVTALGAVLMRSAGCVVNDLTDRKLDRSVARTRTRPLAAGLVSRREALALALVLTAVAGLLVLPLGWPSVVCALAALPLVAAYPWMKRITWWPQAFLGLTFNWGALLGWVMIQGRIELPALLLYAGGIAWTIGYDTIYAHQDARDDEAAGIKSTARLFAHRSPRAVGICYVVALLFWALAGVVGHASPLYLLALLAVGWQFNWQCLHFKPEDPERCAMIFRSNTMIGWLLLLGLMRF